MSKIASYYNVSTRTKKITIHQDEIQWEEWAERTLKGEKLELVCETTSGEVVVHRQVVAKSEAFAELCAANRAKAEAEYIAHNNRSAWAIAVRVTAVMTAVTALSVWGLASWSTETHALCFQKNPLGSVNG
jgi:hypothetical protein